MSQGEQTSDLTAAQRRNGLPSEAGASLFVGRERELQTLHAAFESTLNGSGRIVLLGGEAGIGKTSTCQAFTTAAGQASATVLWGRCFEGDWSPPYAPWVESLDAHARSFSPETLRSILGLGAPALAAILPGIRERLPETPGPASLAPEEERFRLYDAVTQFLTTAARQAPIVLVLDDIHWADRASLRLLRHVSRFVDRAPILVIAVYRDGQADQTPALAETLPEIRREQSALVVRLRGLTRVEVAEYLGRSIRQGIAPELADAIFDETVGNPFFIGELIQHLVEEGKLVERDGLWTVPDDGTGVNDLGVPDGVRQVVARRLANLSSAANQILSHAAIFTGGFDFRTLSALTGLPDDPLLDGLDEALAAGLIRPVDGKLETYDFVHAIVRHTISDSWSPSRRVRLHRRLAEALAQVHAGREFDYAAELAVQYHQSAVLPGAEAGIPHAIAAADRAEATAAREQAVTFLRIGRDLAMNCEAQERAEILKRLGVAEARALMLDDAARTIQEAIANLQDAGASKAEITAYLGTAAAALKDNGADREIWRPVVEQGLAFAGDVHDMSWARLALLRERYAPISTGPIYAARWVSLDADALRLARASDDEDDYARTLQPFEGRNREETDALLARARTWRRPGAINRAYMMAGADLVYNHAAFREAREHYVMMLEVAERTGSIINQAEALVRTTLVQLAMGDFEDAKRTGVKAREMVSRLSPQHRLQASLWWLDAFAAEALGGDWVPIAEYWTRYVGDPAMRESAIVLDDAAMAALAHVRAGTVDDAMRLITALTEGLKPLDASVWLLNGTIGVAGTAVWTLGLTEPAPVFLRLAEDLLRAGIRDYPCCSTDLTIARMHTLMGHHAEATAAFDRARATLKQNGQRPLRAMADYDEAVALLRYGRGAPNAETVERLNELIHAAEAGFAALGMCGWEASARGLRAEVDEAAARAGSRKRASLPAGITARELDILRLVVRGNSDRQIGEDLFLSPRTVNAHIRHMLAKTTLSNRTELSVWAVERGLVER